MICSSTSGITINEQRAAEHRLRQQPLEPAALTNVEIGRGVARRGVGDRRHLGRQIGRGGLTRA